MDTRFHNFSQAIEDVARATKLQKSFSKEVTGTGKTQKLVSIAGSKPGEIKRVKQTYAKPVGFAQQEPLGANRGRSIAVSKGAPEQKKNDGLSKTFPKVFTERIERPPDGLFKTGASQSTAPWQHTGQTPVSMSVPPIRLPGQKLFPMNKQETVASWRVLMGSGGARTKEIGSAPVPPVVIGGPPLVPAPRVPTPPLVPPPKTKVAPILKPSPAPAPAPAPALPAIPVGDARTYKAASDAELNARLKRLPALGTTPMDDAVRLFIENELKTRAGKPATPLPTLSAGEKRRYGKMGDHELKDHVKFLDPLGATPKDDAIRQLIDDILRKRASLPVPAPLPTISSKDEKMYKAETDDQLNYRLKILKPVGTNPKDDVVRQFIENVLINRVSFPPKKKKPVSISKKGKK